MSDRQPPEHVSDGEMLARFVISTRWVRENGTVRQDAFIPPPDRNLSVTRHAQLSADEIRQRGDDVAKVRETELHGRADVIAITVRAALPLNVVAAPIPRNPEHAHVIEWPLDKPSQKALAQEIAATAAYIPYSS